MKWALWLAVLLFRFMFLFGADGIDDRLSLHLGGYHEAGFFSSYSGITGGADLRLGGWKIGLEQSAAWGHTNREIVGITELRLFPHDRIFISLGASYLLAESSLGLEKDFQAALLPLVGFGCRLPLSPAGLWLVPLVRMNQSFYLNEETRSVYGDLPFIIAMTAGVGAVLGR